MLKKYIDYLKDNPQHYWFKAKLYGWGWTPATWQGWLVVLLFITLILLNFYYIDTRSHSVSDTLLNVVPRTAILIILLILICYLTGEKPRWQWGIPKERNKDSN